MQTAPANTVMFVNVREISKQSCSKSKETKTENVTESHVDYRIMLPKQKTIISIIYNMLGSLLKFDSLFIKCFIAKCHCKIIKTEKNHI